jgi:putative acetyltransferase
LAAIARADIGFICLRGKIKIICNRGVSGKLGVTLTKNGYVRAMATAKHNDEKRWVLLTIRPFQAQDTAALRALFVETVHHVNSRDYTANQIAAWAPSSYDETAWLARLSAINPYVAQLNGQIVGYADIQADGYIDHFFCHAQYQRQGIGKALMQKLFATAKLRGIARLYAHVSITAKPFFSAFGFIEVKAQQVEIRGQLLTNFVMEKRG